MDAFESRLICIMKGDGLLANGDLTGRMKRSSYCLAQFVPRERDWQRERDGEREMEKERWRKREREGEKRDGEREMKKEGEMEK